MGPQSGFMAHRIPILWRDKGLAPKYTVLAPEALHNGHNGDHDQMAEPRKPCSPQGSRLAFLMCPKVAVDASFASILGDRTTSTPLAMEHLSSHSSYSHGVDFSLVEPRDVATAFGHDRCCDM
jgi:hypothetical protein